MLNPFGILLFSLLTTNGLASTQTFFGLGAQNIGMGNSTVSVPQDSFSQSYNPALMGLQPRPLFSFGVEGAITEFEKINQIKVDSSELGGSTNPADNIKNVDTKTPDVFVATIGFQTLIGRQTEKPLHLGVNIVSPVDKILGIETQDAYQPQYVMYLSDSQRLTMAFSVARRFFDRWSFGVSVDHYMVQGATARVRLPSGGNSTTKLKMDARSGFAPGAGAVYQLSDTWNVAASYKYKKDYRSEMDLNNTINILSAPSPLYMNLSGSLFYDPENVSLGLSHKCDQSTFALAARYDRWSDYNGSVMRMNFTNFTDSLRQRLPETKFHDVVNLYFGYEIDWSRTSLRAGYGYLPTPVPDQSGESNFLDSDRHVASLGYGWKFIPEWADGPLYLDLVGFLHYLVPKQITKTSNQFIGAPGYKIGGHVYGYALTLTAEL